MAAARFQAEAGRHDVARFEEGVRLQVRKAYEDAVTARSRYATAAKALDAAREVERITQQRFKSGVVKMLDLVDATTARREAETREGAGGRAGAGHGGGADAGERPAVTLDPQTKAWRWNRRERRSS